MIKEIYGFLNTDTASALRKFLNEALPLISKDWWNTCVVRYLPPQDKEIKRTSSLANLDLAKLLHIFNLNWDGISNNSNLPKVARSYLNELRDFRNIFAHPKENSPKQDDIDRCLDTLDRFLKAIKADSILIDKIGKLKSDSKAGQQAGDKKNIPVPTGDTATTKVDIENKIDSLLKKFSDNIIMLDALYQWATTPTGKTAVEIKGYSPYHGLIEDNLRVRYGEEEAKAAYERLNRVCP